MPKSPTTLKLEAEASAYAAEARKSNLEADEIELRLRGYRAHPLNNRSYNFWGGVGAKSAAECVYQLGIWANQSNDPISVIFNSPGGSVIDGLALYDYIKELQAGGVPVNTHSIGMAASMGGVLLQAGGVRTMGANAYLLIHEVSSGAGGKMTELEDEIEFLRRLQDRLVLILAERSTMTARQIKSRWKRKDWWLGAAEAMELGFIDEIG